MDAFAARHDEIAAVVVDLTMPDIGGDEVLARVRGLRPGIPVVLMSGYTQEDFDTQFTGKERVVDVYAGVGTLSLFMAERARRVDGVENMASAVKDARKNARLNGAANISFHLGDAGSVLGRFDRAWGPERPIFGKIRYMSSENTARKVRVKQYLAHFGPESAQMSF